MQRVYEEDVDIETCLNENLRREKQKRTLSCHYRPVEKHTAAKGHRKMDYKGFIPCQIAS